MTKDALYHCPSRFTFEHVHVIRNACKLEKEGNATLKMACCLCPKSCPLACSQINNIEKHTSKKLGSLLSAIAEETLGQVRAKTEKLPMAGEAGSLECSNHINSLPWLAMQLQFAASTKRSGCFL